MLNVPSKAAAKHGGFSRTITSGSPSCSLLNLKLDYLLKSDCQIVTGLEEFGWTIKQVTGGF